MGSKSDQAGGDPRGSALAVHNEMSSELVMDFGLAGIHDAG